KLKEVWFTIRDEHKFFQDFLNTSESSNDDSNVVNMPQEPIVFNKDPDENSSQSPPHIDHHCCYGCGDSLDVIKLRGTFQAWLQQQKDKVVNLDSYSPEPLQCRKIPICYDNEESYTPLRNIIIFKLPPCIAITPVLSTKESLIMGDEHLKTILEKESDEVIKSTFENDVPIPSETEDERECDVPICDDFTTFSNLLFDVDDDFSSNYSLLDEFAGDLILLKSIPSRIDEADCDPEEEIHLIDKLLYDNSSSGSPKEFNSENSDAVIESFSPSPIPFKDSDPFIEEIDLFLTSDGLIPQGIDNDYSDSKGDNRFPEKLLHDDPIPLSDILDFLNVV
nr:hypothetical protein [Tanacetum cinerariifolium]